MKNQQLGNVTLLCLVLDDIERQHKPPVGVVLSVECQQLALISRSLGM